jgi:glutamine amidotransferase
MGWNNVNFNKSSPLTEDLKNEDYFYFVHSYYVPLSDSSIGITEYKKSFTSIIQKENFYGTQFHPEKSSDQGSKLLRNFINL